MSQIEHLIINSPYEKPLKHWSYDREKRTFSLIDGRRPAGYLSSSGVRIYDDPGIFHELYLVNRIRKKVDEWRGDNYPSVTGVTKNLLDFWNESHDRENRFFFCQMEAIETLIWLNEVTSEEQAKQIPSDGGHFSRLCCKMATGTGKTVVMGMLFAWHVLNKITYPNDTRFSKNFLVIAPGLTVKKRLEVLDPFNENSIYKQFTILPSSLYEKLRQGSISVHNWHVLMPLEENPKGVVKKGPETDEAFARRILGHNPLGKDIIVINDEAHHAWRPKADDNLEIQELEEATRWMDGLDKIDKTPKILQCYDFSATPYIPTGKGLSEQSLYEWIISDFSLNDAIESGLVKTPRIAFRDDGRFTKEYHSRFRHIYTDRDVKSDLSRKAAKPEEPLLDLIKNAYYVLGRDWLETKKEWDKEKSPVPPVMITICNSTQTAARIEYSWLNKRFEIEEIDDPKGILHIDSKVLNEAESRGSTWFADSDVKKSRQDKAEILRDQVNTIGKEGKSGQNIQNIIAVAMLSEGWDAKTVTHIMGLRAFTSQLLCEQVVGRGLRRTSYDVNPDSGFFSPEYVNIFGVPFTFLPAEGIGKKIQQPPKPTTRIDALDSKKRYEISWPNIIRVDRTYTPKLTLQWKKVGPLIIDPSDTSLIVQMAPIVDGKPHVDKITTIDLEKLERTYRLQTSIFAIIKEVYENIYNIEFTAGGTILVSIKKDKISNTDINNNNTNDHTIIVSIKDYGQKRNRLEYIAKIIHKICINIL